MNQLSLETMNPCEILRDYGRNLMLTSSQQIDVNQKQSKYSYLFDRYNNICNTENMKTIWQGFDLKSTLDNTFMENSRVKRGFGKNSKFNSGFTATFWIQQAVNNNG